MPIPRPPGPPLPPGGPSPTAAPMPPPQGGPPGMPQGAPAMPPGPPGMPPGASPSVPDPETEQALAQAELLSRLEQLGDQDLHTIQHGISPQAIAVLKKVMPELGEVLDIIEEGVHATQGEMDDDGYEEGDESDEGSQADEADDESEGEAEEPDEPTPLPARPRTKLGQM